MIPTCDDGHLLEQALRSVLDQAPGPDQMQVAVIDDASRTCDVEAIVADVARDRVEVIVHPRRWGAPATFTHCIQAAVGELVHILHADDWILPGFYAAYDEQLARHPEADVAVGRSWFVDGEGRQLGLSGELVERDGLLVEGERALALDNPVNFVAFVVARRAYEAVGGFDPALPHANDWEMWTRLAHRGPIVVVPGTVACYRRHGGSDTTRLQGSMTYLVDPLHALDIITTRMDDADERAAVRQHVHRRLAAVALEVGGAQADAGEHRLAATSAGWAVRLDPRPQVAAAASHLAARALRNRVRGMRRSDATSGAPT